METKEYRLTDVCDFQGGTQPPKEEWVTEPREGYVRMLQIRDFTQDKTEHVGYVKDTKKLNKCEEDDILIGRYGASVGKILTGLSGAYNVAIIKTIPNEELLSKRYLYYVLTGTDFQNFILNIGARAAQAGFNKSDLSLFKLHIPTSLKDQKRIADVLEKAQNLIKQREYSITLLDEFLKMKFLEMFGDPLKNQKEWDIKPLKKFGQIITGNTPPRKEEDNYSPHHIEWIKTDNIITDKIYVSSASEYLSKKGLLKARTVDEGALLVACIAGSIESVGRAALTNRKVAFNQQINAIQPSKDVSPMFLYYLFKLTKSYIQNHASGGMKRMLSKGDFSEILMIKPDYQFQSRFDEICLHVQKIKSLFEQSLTSIVELSNKLSQNALKGELEIIEKIYIEGTVKIQPKITGEVIAIDKINKELEKFHKNQPHTGAPDEIDNTIRQLEAELKIKGEIPFWDEYVKYRIVKSKFKEPFTFEQLWEEITKFPFETVPDYDEVATILFKWLAEDNAFIRQQFNESTKQIELVLNETDKA